MPETLENNITRKTAAPHKVEVYLSDSPFEEGSVISDSYAPMHVVIGKFPNKIAFAKISIQDGEVSKQEFAISDADDFVPGKFITLKMGDVNSVETVFKGIIIKHGIKIKKGRKSLLTLDCRDVATRMAVSCKNKYFAENITDADAIKEITAEYKHNGQPLIDTANVEDTTVEHEGLVQYNSTDWDFALKRANAAGQLVYTDNGSLVTITPTIADEADFKLEYGFELVEFEAEMDARSQFSEVLLKTWDSSKQELLEEDLAKLDGVELDKPGNLLAADLAKATNEEGLTIFYPGQLNARDQKNLVKAELLKSKLARIRGRVSFAGPTMVTPRKTLELKGVGKRFNGLTYITGVRHEFVQSAWKTEIQFGLSRNWLEQNAPSSDLDLTKSQLPEMTGLYIGIVVQVDDESGEDRVKVSVPVIDPLGEGVWARMARPDGGEHRGLFFLPEEKDEVLVGFLNGDPRYPMILGMLNSSAKPAPVGAKDKDNLKGYYSKIGSRVEFDDEKRTLKIQTLSEKEGKSLEDFRSGEPNLEKNNSFILDDKEGTILIQDKNKNYIKFSKDEILIFGDKKITLQSKEIMIKADKKIDTDTKKATFHSSMETKITGTPINLNP